ncbi:hypothetical protein ACVS9P_03595 [Caproicibacterium sp. NSD3]
MKKQLEKKEVDPNSPNARAEVLNGIARQRYPDVLGLPKNEQKYVSEMSRVMVKYRSGIICEEELRAWQVMAQISHLQKPI